MERKRDGRQLSLYLRFVVNQTDEYSGRNMGLFTVMAMLRGDNVLHDYEIDLEEKIYRWFKRNLKVPRAQSPPSNYYRKLGAISRFKSTAKEHIAKMRQYAQILEAHEVMVSEIMIERPGDIVYEDQWQIAAIPFNDTF